MPTRDEIVRSALQLPERERAEVVRDIIDSLDDGDGKDVEKAWAQEAAQRIRDLTEGRATTLPASEAIANARSWLTRRP